MKDLLLGLWAAVRLGAEALWDTATAHWNVAPERCRRIFCGIVAVLLILFAISVLAGAARAENAPDSNFGFIGTEHGVTFACYVSNPSESLPAGVVYTCLVLQAMGPGLNVSTGQVSYCTLTGDRAYTCGEYEEMRKLSIGI